MGSVTVLPRTLIHRTRWGTSIFWDRRQGLLERGVTGCWQSMTREQLRRRYPDAWTAWLSFSRLISAQEYDAARRLSR
jgi:hypothetical protein